MVDVREDGLKETPPIKQIRFVNIEGQPPAKRRRITAACLTCRKRKTRCDGKKPVCTTCVDGGQECAGFAEVEDAGAGMKKERAVEKGSGEGRGNRSWVAHALGKVERGPADGGNMGPEKWDTHTSGTRNGGAADLLGEGGTVARVNEQRRPADDENTALTTESHRVPYFRYFGPTAIVPGFKQMVVSVREHRRRQSSGPAKSPNSTHNSVGSLHGGAQLLEHEPRPAVEMPVYDPADAMPVNRLIIHLVDTFFLNLGCHYQFLSKRQEKVKMLVEEKQIESILVNAICALSARFSDHPLLTVGRETGLKKSEYGMVFAQRAKAAVVDTFPCPTVGAVQACLLLAYEGFGSNQDSALWMYTGCAIRMAIDLGLQKLDGVKHRGQMDHGSSRSSSPRSQITAKEKLDFEQERIDTMWAVFMLDRVISSGTGRPVTLKDEDFELSFPEITAGNGIGWPDPVPVLIQVTHLYGRVSDLLNNIRHVCDVTPDLISQLSAMEADLTQLYQRLDQRLTFNAPNFQHYVKSGEGTSFILVHFRFHTTIMLLHQPTLMHSFEGQILQLLPNSRELSMSSAKTIADMLAFAELIDPRSFIGNPWTSQPIYIAACAFLKEAASHKCKDVISKTGSVRQDEKVTAQVKHHSLLATAANQNYLRCYKALQTLEVYWAGIRYILVALDQRHSGIASQEVETYTMEEYDEATRINYNIVPDWRKKISLTAPSPGQMGDLLRSPNTETPGSPTIDPSQAIGWSLTGTTNSPSSNLTFMYQSLDQPNPTPPIGNSTMTYDPIRQSLPQSASASAPITFSSRQEPYALCHQTSGPMPPPNYRHSSTSEPGMFLGLGQNSQYSHQPYGGTAAHRNYDIQQPAQSIYPPAGNSYMRLSPGLGDMMMESQDIDMSALGQVGGSMMPWLEYLPQDLTGFYEGGNREDMVAKRD